MSPTGYDPFKLGNIAVEYDQQFDTYIFFKIVGTSASQNLKIQQLKIKKSLDPKGSSLNSFIATPIVPTTDPSSEMVKIVTLRKTKKGYKTNKYSGGLRPYISNQIYVCHQFL